MTAAPRTEGVPAIRVILALVSLSLILAVSALKIGLSEAIITPDSELFLRISDNIRLNGCLSHSPPESRECRPAWGSQPPGYPVFLAALRAFGHDPGLIVALQVIVFTGAAFWLAVSVPYDRGVQLTARVFVLVASPLTLAWGRWVLTETLATATTMCTFAVICRASHAKRLNVPSLALMLAIAMLIRWDQICLLLPAVAVICFLYPPRQAVIRALIVVFAASLPYAALSLRAVHLGLPLFPTNTVDLDMPPNILRFWRIAALDQRVTTGLIWESWSRRYANVRALDLGSISSSAPQEEMTQLIDRIARLPAGSVFPDTLDQDFGRIASRMVSEHPIQSRIAVPLVRAIRMWTWQDKQFSSGWQGLGSSVEHWEGWRTAYRVLLVFGCGVALFQRCGQRLRRLSILVSSYAIGRTCFLVAPSLTMLETRYLVETFPVMELVVLLVVERFIASLLPSHRYTRSSTSERNT